MVDFTTPAPERARLGAELEQLYAEGKIKPRVSRTFPLERAHEAIQALSDRSAVGKIVVKVED